MATGAAKGRGRPEFKAPPVPKVKKVKAEEVEKTPEPAPMEHLLSVKAVNPCITSDQYAIQYHLPFEEVMRYRHFINEYVRGWNEEHACLRMGYPAASARTTAQIFMGNPYVQLALQEYYEAIDAANIVTGQFIIERLVKEATARDSVMSGCAMSNSSTRISALKELIKIKGMDKPKPTQDEQPVIRVMMLRPLNGDTPEERMDDWETKARASQRALKESTLIDV